MVEKDETTEYIEPFVNAVRDYILEIVDGELMDLDEYELFCSLLSEMIEGGLPEFEID